MIQFYEMPGSYPQLELPEEFGVSLSTLEKWLLRWRTTGNSDALLPTGGRPQVAKTRNDFYHLVAKQPNATLDELQQKLL